MNITESEPTEIISGRVRGIAVVAALLAIAAGFMLGGIFFQLVACPLILGAIVQPRSHRSGRWLMGIGASLLSLFMLPAIFFQLSAILKSQPSIIMLSRASRISTPQFDPGLLTVVSLLVILTLLLLWCDVELLVDANQARRAPKVESRGFPEVGDWLLWLFAFGLSLWWLPLCMDGISVYHHTRSMVLLLLSLGWGMFIILLDAAVVANSMKAWRTARGGAWK